MPSLCSRLLPPDFLVCSGGLHCLPFPSAHPLGLVSYPRRFPKQSDVVQDVEQDMSLKEGRIDEKRNGGAGPQCPDVPRQVAPGFSARSKI